MNEAIIRYLPIFKDDLQDALTYIRDTLHNNIAANNLVDEVKKAIEERSYSPESFEQYHSSKYREYPYYRIYVKNYVIYYVVIPNKPPIMEVRRFLYNKRDRELIV